MVLALTLALVATGCRRENREPVLSVAYVSSNSARLRDRLGASQMTVATVKTADRLEILRRRRRWLWVRTAAGAEGWIEERHIVPQETYERFQKLRQEVVSKISQGQARARQDLNLHLEPARKSPRFYQLKEDELCEVLERRIAERPAPPGPPAEPGPEPPPQKKYEDWYLVRSRDKAGWGLARYLDMAVPDEVLQNAEGKRIAAWFVLDQEAQGKEEKPAVLWTTTEREGAVQDFDSIRVFVWSRRRRRYETVYIERNLKGFYPIQVWRQQTEQGEFPAFSLTLEDRQGGKVTRKFILRANLVRRYPVL